VFELGIGTGRIALPLLERGAEIHGIDASPAKLEKLKLKDKDGKIPVQIGVSLNLKRMKNMISYL
jgi:methylase of polypeptide subunit release factors